MKHKRIMSVLVATALIVTVGNGMGSLPIASADETSDAVVDVELMSAGSWTLDEQTVRGGEILEGVDGMVHFRASAQAGNGAQVGQ